jgi:HTH-type transcriptional regulator / antitoxin HigA
MATNIKQLTPAIAIHPGEILKDELQARDIKQKEFALLTGIPQTQLNEIIKGKRGINADIALLIGKTLKMDPVLWLNLQNNYELDLAKVNEKNSIRLTAIDQWQMVKPYIPHKFYKKHGVLTGNPVCDIPVVKNIYGVNNFEQLAGVYSQTAYSRFRKSNKLSIDKINLVGWVKLVNYQATNLAVQNFDSHKQNELITELKAIFRKNKKTVEKTIETLASYGIKLIIQPHPEKCAVDGISFWSNGNPAIGISLRHKRIDDFAFTIMHELGHIFLHLINNNAAEFIDLDKEHSTPEYKKSKDEKEANEFSRNSLIEKIKWDSFINDNPHFDEESIKSFANKMKIHPGIVLGRYCFEMNFFGKKSAIDKTLF